MMFRPLPKHLAHLAGFVAGVLVACSPSGSPLPGAPTAVTAAPGDGQASVQWTAPTHAGTSAITGYKVTSTPGGFTATTTGSTTVSVTGLANGTSYTFTVHATNAHGSGPESAPSNAVTPASVPGAPTNVQVTAGNKEVVVTWTRPESTGGSPVTGYTVTSKPGGFTATSTSATTATVTGLTNGTSYTFTVHATNAMGNGPESAASSPVTPVAVPGPPTGVTATASTGLATVSWQPPTDDGGSAITGYVVTAMPGGMTIDAGAGATTATVPGLTNGTTYTFTVVAQNAAGNGIPSQASNAVVPTGPPSRPLNVVAVAGDGQVTLTWAPPFTNGGSSISGYLIDSSPPISTIMAWGNVTTWTVPGLANGVSYAFTVTAVNVAGPGPKSVPSNAVTPESVPDPPTNVVALPGNGQATLTWIAPANTGGIPLIDPYYIVTASTDPNNPIPLHSMATTYVATGLTNGKPVSFSVRAVNASGNSMPGNSAAVIPFAPGVTPSASRSSLTVGPATLYADGISRALITVTIKDEAGTPVQGQLVVLSVSGSANQITPIGGQTDANGVFTASLTSTHPEVKTIKAIAGSVVLFSPVTFNAPACSSAALFSPLTPALSVGAGPQGIASGDVDGDGKLDLIVADTTASQLSVLRGMGNATFGMPLTYDVGASPVAVVTGDFNGDGVLDLAAANSGDNSVSVLIGKGDGTFQPAASFSVGTLPVAIIAEDFNGDGHLDLATANLSSHDVSVLLGKGDGTFQAARSNPIGHAPVALAAGDFNGDGKLDIMVADSADSDINLLVGGGDGSFMPGPSTPMVASPTALVTGDFNSDGSLDLAVTDAQNNAVIVLFGRGEGTFASMASFPIGTAPSALATGDFNGDGHLDIAVTGSNAVAVLWGTGGGQFQMPAASYPTGASPAAITAGDFNGDGRLDLATANSGDGTATVLVGVCGP